MTIEPNAQTLVVSNLRELTAGTASEVKSQARLRFSEELKDIDFDCKNLEFLDSSGLGALISIQKLANGRGGKFRILNPQPTILQILEMTRLHRIFDIVA
jgi:anti-sigma B factor antagonist